MINIYIDDNVYPVSENKNDANEKSVTEKKESDNEILWILFNVIIPSRSDNRLLLFFFVEKFNFNKKNSISDSMMMVMIMIVVYFVVFQKKKINK